MADSYDSRFLDEPDFQSLLVGCLESLERGETIDREALVKDFPRYAQEIEQFLNDRQLLENVASDLGHVEPSRVAISAYAHTMDSGSARKDFAAGEAVRYIGEYEILGEIARGGMGVVFKARQQKLNRTVALKMILAGRLADSADVERFHLEARAAGRLQHSNIVPVHEVGEHDGRHYFTMDFVEGRSLAEQIREETLPSRTAATLVRKTALAVQYAHDQGTIHRDLKPGNILIDPSGEPKVTDFGLAKMFGGGDDETRAELTASGQVLGTPSYMAPEQASGNQELVGPASDIYSLGAILYACLTGRAPFVADSPVDTLLQVIHNEPVSLRMLNSNIPRDLETICLKSLQKRPHERYSTAQSLADDLDRFLSDEPIMARPVGRIERGWRWCRRNRMVASLLALVAALMIVGTAVSSWFAVAEHDQRLVADQTKDRLAVALGETKDALQEMQVARDNEAEAKAKAEKARGEAIAARTLAEQKEASARQAQRAAEFAQRREAAQRKKTEAEKKRAQWQAYVARLLPMRQAWLDQDFGHLNRLLQESVPLDDEPDFRGWEWFYFQDQVHTASKTLGASGTFTGRFAHDRANSRILAALDNENWELWDLESDERVDTFVLDKCRPETVRFSPDGMKVAWGTWNCRLRVLDVNGKKLLNDIDAHPEDMGKEHGHIGAVAWSPAGDQLASASGPGGMKIWDAKSGSLVRMLQEASHDNVTMALDWHADAGLLSAHRYGVARVWDVETGRVILERNYTNDWPAIACWNPSGDAFLYGSNSLKVYSRDGRRLAHLAEHGRSSDAMLTATWIDDARIAYAGADQTVTLYDTAESRVLSTYRVHSAPIVSLAGIVGAAAAEALVSGGTNGTIRRFKVGRTVDANRTVRAHPSEVNGLDWEPTGNRIATTGWDGKARVWDAHTLASTLTFSQHTHYRVYDIEWCNDGAQLASLDQHGVLALWDPDSGEVHFRRLAHRQDGNSLDWNPFARHLAIGGRQVRLFRESDREEMVFQTPVGLGIKPSFDPAGRRFAGVVRKGTFGVFDAMNGRKLFDNRNPGVEHRTAWSPNGRIVAAGGTAVNVYNANDGELISKLAGHRGAVLDLDFDPSGRRLASVGGDNHLNLWDVATGDLLLRLPVPDAEGLLRVQWSPDGRRIAMTTRNGNLSVWGTDDMPTMNTGLDFLKDGAIAGTVEPVRSETEIVLSGRHPRLGGITGLKATPDGQRVVMNGYFKGLRMWDVSEQRSLDFFEDIDDSVHSIDVDPHGKYVVATVKTGEIKIWDLETGELQKSYHGHDSQEDRSDGFVYIFVCCSPEGDRFATFGHDKIARIWNLQGELLAEHQAPRQLYCATFTPNGDRLLFGGSGGWLADWHLETDECREFPRQPGNIWTLKLTHDAKHVLLGTNSEIRLVDLQTHESLRTFVEDRKVTQLEWVAGDQFILSAGFDGFLRIWDLHNDASPVLELAEDESILETICLLDNGHSFASAGVRADPRTTTSRSLHTWALPAMLWPDEESMSGPKRWTDPDEIQKAESRLAEMSPLLLEETDHPDGLLEYVSLLNGLGRWPEPLPDIESLSRDLQSHQAAAITRLALAARESPFHSEPWIELGAALRHEGKHEEAIRVLRHVDDRLFTTNHAHLPHLVASLRELDKENRTLEYEREYTAWFLKFSSRLSSSEKESAELSVSEMEAAAGRSADDRVKLAVEYYSDRVRTDPNDSLARDERSHLIYTKRFLPDSTDPFDEPTRLEIASAALLNGQIERGREIIQEEIARLDQSTPNEPLVGQWCRLACLVPGLVDDLSPVRKLARQIRDQDSRDPTHLFIAIGGGDHSLVADEAAALLRSARSPQGRGQAMLFQSIALGVDGQLAEGLSQFREGTKLIADHLAPDTRATRAPKGSLSFAACITTIHHEAGQALLEALNDAIKETPADAALLAQRGEVHRVWHRWSEASADFRRAAELASEEIDHLQRAAITALQAGQHETFSNLMEKLIERAIDSEGTEQAWAAGRIAALAPEHVQITEELLDAVQASSRLQPRQWWRRMAVAGLMHRLGRNAEAAEELRIVQSYGLGWHDRAAAKLWQGLVMESQGNVDEAKIAHQSAVDRIQQNLQPAGVYLHGQFTIAEVFLLPNQLEKRINAQTP